MPEAWRGLPLGTPLADFQASGVEATAEGAFADFRTAYVVAPSAEGEPEVTLYFDVDLEGQPLYEYIFVYADGTDVSGIAEALWGPPNDGERWSLSTDGETALSAWTFSSTLVITAPWPGTEWDPGEGE